MGEFDLIAAMRARLGAPGPQVVVGVGDDASVTTPEGATATSVDAIVEGVHFERATTPLEAVGGKALAAALSDLAAMGASPGEAYVVLGVPADLAEEGCLEIFAGLEAVAQRTGTTLAGGDITRSAVLFVSMTVVGHAPDASRLVRRGGARPGDVVAVTGELGGAAAALRLDGTAAAGISAAVAAALRARQLDPQPRIAEGIALADAGARAMIDVSDGLGADAGHVAAESGVAIEIDLSSVPVQEGVAEVAEATGAEPLALATGEGEDYELLACLAPESLDAATAAVADAGGTLTAVGRCVGGEGGAVKLSDPAGRELPARGYDQLS